VSGIPALPLPDEAQLEGIRDAAVRRHQALGGSHGQLGRAMGAPRSTARTHTEALLAREPSPHERWVLTRGAVLPPAAAVGDEEARDADDGDEIRSGETTAAWVAPAARGGEPAPAQTALP
jgi:hypothetical protein